MAHAEQSFIKKYIFSTDHKVIGKQYLITGIIMGFVAGMLAYGFRMQLAFPSQDVPLLGKIMGQKYNAFVTMHGMIMFFWFAMPVLLAAVGNLLIPLMLGTDDMVFPKLNMASYWIFLLSTIILIASFFVPGGAFAGGWTIYPPLSADGYNAQGLGFLANFLTGGTFLILAVALEFVSMLLGGINFITTTINRRTKGMKFMDMPILIWFINIASADFMFSVGPLIAGAVLLLLDRIAGTGFYDPSRGGDPVLFQHLFWFFGHPEVYVVLLPSIGMIAEIIPVFSRKPLFAYKIIVYSALISGVIALIVWAHHQFIAGIDPRMAAAFSITTIIISIPLSVIIFAFIATLYGGSIQFTTSMLWAIGMLATFLIGGVTGIYLGSSAIDIYAHDTYFVVAHFHYTMIPIAIFGAIAGFYFWFPKFTGRFMNETIGKLHFWITMITFNGLFFPLFFLGLGGYHRRIYDYSSFPSLMKEPFLSIQKYSTWFTVIFIAAQVLLVFNIVYSYFKGKKAEKNPWLANTLEWQAESPPPHGNFAAELEVFHGPYEYSLPDRQQDYLPQSAK